MEIISKVGRTAVRRSLHRLVRCGLCLESAPNVRVMKHGQNESGWREKGDKRAQTDQQAESWM